MDDILKLATNRVKKLIPIFRSRSSLPVEAGKTAAYLFVHDNYNCSEAIVQSFDNENRREGFDLLGAASPFGGGIGGSGKTCGALTGGLLVLGAHARKRGLDKKAMRELSADFVKRFTEEFKAEDCATLSRHDCDDPAQGDFDLNHCSPYLSFSANLVEEFLNSGAPGKKQKTAS